MAAVWTLGVGKQRRSSCPVTFNERKEESGEEEEARQMSVSISTERPPSREPASGSTSEDRVNLHKELDPLERNVKVTAPSTWAGGSVVQPSSSYENLASRRKQVGTCWFNMQDVFLDPEGRRAYCWMVLVTMAVIYNLFVVILRIAFEDIRVHPLAREVFPWVDVLSDVIYLLDIGIQSRTAYLEDGCLVRDLRLTVRHYTSKFSFVLDVLSVAPITTMLVAASSLRIQLPVALTAEALCEGIATHRLSTFLFIRLHAYVVAWLCKTGEASPVFRLPRLLKYHSMSRFFEKTDRRTNSPNVLRAFKLSLHIWLIIHWSGCFYYLISRYEGLGVNGWVYPADPAFASFQRKYVVCMFWSTMTLITVGEQAAPVTNIEYVFTGFTFLVGVFVFAAVVGNVGDVISNMNAARNAFQSKMDQIKFYMNHRQVPEHLQDSVKRWAEYTWARTKAIDDPSVLELLPDRLRTEVAIHVHLDTLKKVRIFKQCEEGLLRELVLKLRPSIFSPGEYICRIGEIGREMYIIDHGRVEILLPDPATGEKKQVAIMTAGNYFGEISLLKLDDGQNKRTADVRSVGFSELLCLSRRDLMSALTEYPEARKVLEAQARQRMLQTKKTSSSEVTGRDTSSFDHSSSSFENLSNHSDSKTRTTRSVLVEMIRSEGFSRLMGTKAAQELNEMAKILKELKEVKDNLAEKTVSQLASHCTILEASLKEKEEELRQIRLRGKKDSMSVGAGLATSDASSPSLISPSHSSGSRGKCEEGHMFSSPSSLSFSPPRRSDLLRTPDSLSVRSDTKVASVASSHGRMSPGRSEFGHSKHVVSAIRVLPPFAPSVVPRRRFLARIAQNLHLKTDQQKNDISKKTSSASTLRRMGEKPTGLNSVKTSHTSQDMPPTQTSADSTGDAVCIPTKEDQERTGDLGDSAQERVTENYPQILGGTADSAGGDSLLFGSQIPSQTLFCSSITSAVGSRSSFEIVSATFVDVSQTHNMEDKDAAITETAQDEKIGTELANNISSDSSTSSTTGSRALSSSPTTGSYPSTSSSNSNTGNKPNKHAKPRPRYKDLKESKHSRETVPLEEDLTVSEREGLLKSHNTKEISKVAGSTKVDTALKDAQASPEDNAASPSQGVGKQKPNRSRDGSISPVNREADHLDSRSQQHFCENFSGRKEQDISTPKTRSKHPAFSGKLSDDLGCQEKKDEVSASGLKRLMVEDGNKGFRSSEMSSAAEDNEGTRETDKNRHPHRKTAAGNTEASRERVEDRCQWKSFVEHSTEITFSIGSPDHPEDTAKEKQADITSVPHKNNDRKQPELIPGNQTNRNGKHPQLSPSPEMNEDREQLESPSSLITNSDDRSDTASSSPTRRALKTCRKIDDSQLSVLLAKRREISAVSKDKTETGIAVCNEKSWKTCKKIDDSQLAVLLAKRKEISAVREDKNENSVIGNVHNSSKTQKESNKGVKGQRNGSADVKSQDGNNPANNGKQPRHSKDMVCQNEPIVVCSSGCSYKRFGFSTNDTSTKGVHSDCGFSGLLPGKGSRIPRTRLRSPLRPLPFWKAFKTGSTESTHEASSATETTKEKNICVGDQNVPSNDAHLHLGRKAHHADTKIAAAQAPDLLPTECLNVGARKDASVKDKTYPVSVLIQKPESCVDKVLEGQTNKDDTFNVTHSTSLFYESSKTEEQASPDNYDPLSDCSSRSLVSDSMQSSSENSECSSCSCEDIKSRKAEPHVRLQDTGVLPFDSGSKLSESTKEHITGAEITSTSIPSNTFEDSSPDVCEDNSLTFLRRRYSAARFRRRSIDKSHESGTFTSDSSNATSPDVERLSLDHTALNKRQKYNTKLSPLITKFEERKKNSWMQSAEEKETSPGQPLVTAGEATDIVPQKVPITKDTSYEAGIDTLDIGDMTSSVANDVKPSGDSSQPNGVNTLQSVSDVPGEASEKHGNSPSTSPAMRRRALRRKLSKRFSHAYKKDTPKVDKHKELNISPPSSSESQSSPLSPSALINTECSDRREHFRKEKLQGSTKDSCDPFVVLQDGANVHIQKCENLDKNDEPPKCDSGDSLGPSSVKRLSEHASEVYAALSNHIAPASPSPAVTFIQKSPQTLEIPVEGVLSSLTLTSSNVSLLQSDDDIEGRRTNNLSRDSPPPHPVNSGNNSLTFCPQMSSELFQCADGSDCNSLMDYYCNTQEQPFTNQLPFTTSNDAQAATEGHSSLSFRSPPLESSSSRLRFGSSELSDISPPAPQNSSASVMGDVRSMPQKRIIVEENATELSPFVHQNKSSSAGGDTYAAYPEKADVQENVVSSVTPQVRSLFVEGPKDTWSHLASSDWGLSVCNVASQGSCYSSYQTNTRRISSSFTGSKVSVSSSPAVLRMSPPTSFTTLGQDDNFQVSLLHKNPKDKTRRVTSYKSHFSMYPPVMRSRTSDGTEGSESPRSKGRVDPMCASLFVPYTAVHDGARKKQARMPEKNCFSNRSSAGQPTGNDQRQLAVTVRGRPLQQTAEDEGKSLHASPLLGDLLSMMEVTPLQSDPMLSPVDVSTGSEEEEQPKTGRGGGSTSTIRLSDFGLADEEASDMDISDL